MKGKVLSLMVMILLVATNAHALPGYDGKILSVLTGENAKGLVFIEVETSRRTGTPSCHINPVYGFAFSLATPEGQAYLSLVLSAYMAQKNVTITGYDSCNVAGSERGVTDFRSIRLR